MASSDHYILQTERLGLRQYTEDDAEEFFRLNSDPAVMRYIWDKSLSSLEEAREVLRSHPILDYEKHGFGRWACLIKSTGQNIGFVGLKFLEELNEVDLGFRLLPEHWGRGFASEAAEATLRYGFDQLGLERVIALARTENRASIRVFEKLGMQFEETTQHAALRVVRYAIANPHPLPR